MSLIKDLAKYISEQTSLTIGTDLFLGFMPLDKSAGVILSQDGGEHNDSGMLQVLIEVASLADDYTTAETNCYTVYNKLVYSNGFYIDSGYVFNCVPVAIPSFGGITEHQKVVITSSISLFKEN